MRSREQIRAIFAALQGRGSTRSRAKYAVRRGLVTFGGPDWRRPLYHKGKKQLVPTPKGLNYLEVHNKFSKAWK